jgi:heterotetrameric sarcosine oxidase gamma subunit
MADPFDRLPLVAPGVEVEVLPAASLASLRYFSTDGPFAQAIHGHCGVSLPGTGRAVSAAGQDLLLAWRAPSETLVLAAHPDALQALAAAVAACGDGCLIELTGALRVLRLSGARSADVLARLGGPASLPQPGEARRSRLAEVPVLAVSMDPQEILLWVDRAFVAHLEGWLRETLLDLAEA